MLIPKRHVSVAHVRCRTVHSVVLTELDLICLRESPLRGVSSLEHCLFPMLNEGLESTSK